MGAITSLRRDWRDNVCIVGLITTDTLATALGANYITNQAANILAVNNGPFSWLTNDCVLVNASDGTGLYGISSDLSSLVSLGNAVNASVNISAAQWNGMYAAPVELVAAPGANKMIIVSKLSLAMTYGSAQYASGGAVAAQYDSTVHGAGVAATATLAAATVNGLVASTVENLAGAASVVYSGAVNKALYLSNATGAFTTGDSPWVASVQYYVIPTA